MISILTVTYKQLKKLKKLYKSMLEQKKYIKEWVVYDDISEDGTIEWIEGLKAPFPIKLIKGIKRDRPLVVANMNACIREAENGLFMLVFADTYLGENCLEKLYKTYIPNSFGSAFKINVDEKGNFISNHYHNIDYDAPFCLMQFQEPWKQMSGNGMIATKEIMERINYIDENYTGYGIDDYDTAMRAMMNGALLFVYTNVKIYHIDHPTKDSTQDNIMRLKKKLEGEGYRL